MNIETDDILVNLERIKRGLGGKRKFGTTKNVDFNALFSSFKSERLSVKTALIDIAIENCNNYPNNVVLFK